MQVQLQDYINISESRSESELLNKLVALAHRMDFERINAFLRVSDASGHRKFAKVFSNTPQGYLEKSGCPDAGQRDPVFQRQLHSSLPFVSNQQMYVDAGSGDLWEEASPFGYRTGISLSLALPNYTHFMFNMDRHEALPSNQAIVADLMGSCQMLAVHAHAAATQMIGAEAVPAEKILLTPRERSVLQWAMGNKSAWSTGQILAISENTVKFHMKNAMRKLGATSRHQAILMAINLGLI